MKKIKPLEGEELISESQNGVCTLTNYRIYYSDVQFGKAYFLSILLENISSVEISYRSNIFILLFGILSVIIGVAVREALVLGLIFGMILILAYFLSRRHYIVISPNGGVKMKLLVKGMKTSEVLKFHNQIEQAIIKRTVS
jgi:hypothetical protein